MEIILQTLSNMINIILKRYNTFTTCITLIIYFFKKIKLTIRDVGPACKKIDSIVSLKKKIVRVI
jgi:hypothetical protein